MKRRRNIAKRETFLDKNVIYGLDMSPDLYGNIFNYTSNLTHILLVDVGLMQSSFKVASMISLNPPLPIALAI